MDRICGFLSTNDLKITLLLSRKFRYLTERPFGAFEEFTPTEPNSERFLAVYSGHRWLYV